MRACPGTKRSSSWRCQPTAVDADLVSVRGWISCSSNKTKKHPKTSAASPPAFFLESTTPATANLALVDVPAEAMTAGPVVVMIALEASAANDAVAKAAVQALVPVEARVAVGPHALRSSSGGYPLRRSDGGTEHRCILVCAVPHGTYQTVWCQR